MPLFGGPLILDAIAIALYIALLMVCAINSIIN